MCPWRSHTRFWAVYAALPSGRTLVSKQVVVAALLMLYKQAKQVILFKNRALFLTPISCSGHDLPIHSHC